MSKAHDNCRPPAHSLEKLIVHLSPFSGYPPDTTFEMYFYRPGEKNAFQIDPGMTRKMKQGWV